MSLKDFAHKKRREITEQGVGHAGLTGVKEAVAKALRRYARYQATPIWASDADVVLILDACRFDTWQEMANTDWQAKGRWSLGSASVEWINETFANRYENSWSQAAYVTGNPHTAKDGGDKWRDSSVYPLKQRGLMYLDEVWRDQWDPGPLETVSPDVMTARGFYAYEHANADTVVVHYMQPHVPFRNAPEWTGGWANTLAFGEADTDKKDDWCKLRDGDVPPSEFWDAYRDNLQWVLAEVKRWRDAVNGTILVTSDHGNAAGEYGQWGHPPGSGNPTLRKVPWLLLEGRGNGLPKYDVPGDPPVTKGIGDVDGVDERLEALGYR